MSTKPTFKFANTKGPEVFGEELEIQKKTSQSFTVWKFWSRRMVCDTFKFFSGSHKKTRAERDWEEYSNSFLHWSNITCQNLIGSTSATNKPFVRATKFSATERTKEKSNIIMSSQWVHNLIKISQMGVEENRSVNPYLVCLYEMNGWVEEWRNRNYISLWWSKYHFKAHCNFLY